jgi:hypothetical protein
MSWCCIGGCLLRSGQWPAALSRLPGTFLQKVQDLPIEPAVVDERAGLEPLEDFRGDDFPDWRALPPNR